MPPLIDIPVENLKSVPSVDSDLQDENATSEDSSPDEDSDSTSEKEGVGFCPSHGEEFEQTAVAGAVGSSPRGPDIEPAGEEGAVGFPPAHGQNNVSADPPGAVGFSPAHGQNNVSADPPGAVGFSPPNNGAQGGDYDEDKEVWRMGSYHADRGGPWMLTLDFRRNRFPGAIDLSNYLRRQWH